MSDRSGTHRSVLVAPVVALVVALAAGCDASPGPTDGGFDAGVDGDAGPLVIPDDVSLERYCELAPTFWCEWLDRCRRGCDEYFAGVGANPRGWCEAMAERVNDGSVAYDPARATECLRLAQSELDATCETGEESRGALHDCVPFEGRRAPGESCVLPFPLESTCDPSLGTCSALPYAERCPGTCVAFLAEGEPCDPTSAGAAECAPGAYCFEDACVPRPLEGEPCGDVPCVDGVLCLPEGDALVCRAPSGLDEPCDAPHQCEDGLGCSAELMRCVQTVARGEACRSSEECAEADYCGVDGTCAARRAEGEACIEAECADGLECALHVTAAEERCQPLASEGEPCDPGVCGADLWCRHDEGGHRCAAIGAVGDDCSGEPSWTLSVRCQPDAFCNDGGTCEAQRAPDEPCDPDAFGTPECDVEAGVTCDPFTHSCLGPGEIEGARCLGVCTGELYCNVDICEPRFGVGEPCPGSDSCVEGAACVDLDGSGPRCWGETSCGE